MPRQCKCVHAEPLPRNRTSICHRMTQANRRNDTSMSPQATNPLAITTIFLCGGNGVRMQGLDKPLMQVWRDGTSKPMIDHILGATPDTGPVLISANRNLDAYAKRGEVITDAELGVAAQGPLAGILAGLQRASTPWLLVCPGDTPFLAHRWHQTLINGAASASSDARAFTVHDGERLQPLHSLLRVEAEPLLRRYLAAGKRSVRGWLRALRTVPIEHPAPAQFASINYPSDLPAQID